MLQTALIVAAMSAALASALPAAVKQSNSSFTSVRCALVADTVCVKSFHDRNGKAKLIATLGG